MRSLLAAASSHAIQQCAIPYRALVGTGGEQGVSLQRSADLARARFGWFPTLGILFNATALQFRFIHQQVDATLRNIDADPITLANQANRAAAGCFW